MRNPNGYGGIRKLSGNRRRPFQVRITAGWDYVDGKQKQKYNTLGYYATRKEAMMALAEYNKNPYDLKADKVTFAEIFQEVKKSKIESMKKPSQLSYNAAYKKCLPLHSMKMSEIKKPQLQAVFDNNAELSKSSQNNIRILMGLIFRYCMENDILQKDYSQYITITAKEKESIRSPFSADEIKKLWCNLDYITESTNKHANNLAWMDSIIIMLYTGCRINELLDIKTEWINLQERIIDVHGTKNKTSRRLVPIHKDILPLIEKRMALQDSDYLFPDADGKRITYAVYKPNVFIETMNHFNMQHLPHDCRHTFATYAAKSDMKDTVVKRILGHTFNDITQDVYTHALKDELVREIDKLKF